MPHVSHLGRHFGRHFGRGRWRSHNWRRGPRTDGPWRRGDDDRLIGGVAAGFAARTGLDVTVVRVGLVLLTLITVGYAAVGYVLAWLLLPVAGSDASIAHRAKSDRRGIGLSAAVGTLLIVLAAMASAVGAGWVSAVEWPVVICTAGLVLIWRNGTAGEQETMRHLAEPLVGLTAGGRRPRLVWRLAIAFVLFLAGTGILVSGHESVRMLAPLGGGVLVLAAIALVLGPWWLGIARDLVAERRARIRAEERADMAARVHDSVLQTLAMIQRRADQPQQVIQLARAQERELRSWLFDGRAPGSMDTEMTLSAGVRQIQQEVEAQHRMTVEAVTVGDCELDEDLGALLEAAREATVNAAKWSGADVVSLFAEVEPDEVSLFVRDRGKGFDPEAVPADRKGLAESIHARMTRRGGEASIRSAVGQGTEVSLTMPRVAGKRQSSRS
ncbi:MAG TPA: PspC domain-containing protein [Streptosporangiaceae bacterium]|nr:PspC domain-containing protein [Streptosporangiaceae bacterium]